MKYFSRLFPAFLMFFCVNYAYAFQYDAGRFAFKLSGYGTVGMLEPDLKQPNFLYDWRVRAQLNYANLPGQTLGVVYAIDATAIDDNNALREAFAFWEYKRLGRVELGVTDSIARKLGVGLPDVGGLRVNDRPLFYKEISPESPVISDTVLTTGRSALRINMASLPTNKIQYGLSIAGLTDDYDYAVDAGLKIRRPNGKMKTALSLGASFMGAPDGYRVDAYTPRVTADWRAQVSMGANIQYNSWVLGANARLVYDENPSGPVSDGLAAGAGVSYDLLKYSVSLNYIFSDTGVWQHNVKDFIDHTVVASFRYKYSENVDGWMSAGITTKTTFFAAGLRLSF